MTISVKSIEDNISGDLQVTRGDSITWQDTVVDIESGEAVDITGAALTFSIKENIDSVTEEIKKTVGDGIVIDPDQVNNKGKYKFSLIPSDTEDLDIKLYEHDIEIVLSGKTQTISRGSLQILSDITN